MLYMTNKEWYPTFNTRTMVYLCWQLQRCPTTGKIHLQGYTQFKHQIQKALAIKYHKFPEDKPISAAAFKYQIAIKASDTRSYCLDDEKKTALAYINEKDETCKPLNYEEGVFDETVTKEEKKQGARTDLLEIKRRIDEEGLTAKQCRDEEPVTYSRYHRTIDAWYKEKCEKKGPWCKEQKWMEAPETWEPAKAALEFLAKEGDRMVMWFWSDKGATGKTTLLKWLTAQLLKKKERVYYVHAERSDRLAHGYDCQPYVFLDCPRDAKDLPYHFIEMCRDNHITSGMYGVCNKIPSKPIHVIVCANMPPDPRQLSDDLTVVNMDPVVRV
jgi:hypothetical protein